MGDGHDGGLQAHTGSPLVYDPNTGTHWRICYATFGGDLHPNGRKRMTLVYEECSRLERDREVCARQYDQWDRPDVYCVLPLRPCPEHRFPHERICDECGMETVDQTCIFIGCPTNADQPSPD